MSATMGDELRTLAGDARYPTMRERLRTSPNLTAQGTQRLSAAELDELNELRIRLARASDAICRAMWTGQTDESVEATVRAFESFPEKDRRTWARLMAR